MPCSRTGSRTKPKTNNRRHDERGRAGQRGSRLTPEILERLQADSRRAYFARSVFTPTAAKRTTSFVSSVERLDADDAADAELRVADAHARLEREAGRLILVLVRVGRRFLARAAAAAFAVRVGAELVVREVALLAAEKVGAMRSTSSAGTSSMKRDGSLD